MEPKRHCNPEAERSLLGSALVDNAIIEEVGTDLSPDDFGVPANGQIWRLMLDLRSSGNVADFVSVAEAAGDEALKDLGGAGYLAALLPQAGTQVQAKSYVRVIRRHATTRRVIATCQEIIEEANSQALKPEELLDSAERRVFALTQASSDGKVQPNSVVIDEALALLQRRVELVRSGQTSGALSYGITELDKATAGMHNGELIVVGARPGVGKTILGAHLADVAANNNQTALFVSLEQARYELSLRLLSKHSLVNSFRIRSGVISDAEVDKITTAAADQRHKPLFWDDTPSQTVWRIAANARRLKARLDLRLLVVDYMQLIEPSSKKMKRHEQVGEMSRALKLLARDLKIPVVAMAQLNRDVENRGGKPKLSDLRESGSVEQDADTVILMHPRDGQEGERPDEGQDEDRVRRPAVIELLIRKQRNGPICDVLVAHDKTHYALVNYQEDDHARNLA